MRGAITVNIHIKILHEDRTTVTDSRTDRLRLRYCGYKTYLGMYMCLCVRARVYVFLDVDIDPKEIRINNYI